MRRSLLLCLVIASWATVGGEVLESRGGNFRVETTVDKDEIKEQRSASRWSARVTTQSGELLYTLDKSIPYGSPFPGVQISDHSGEAVTVDAFAGTVEFYDSRGTLARRWRPFGDAPPDHERILKCSVAGDRLAFLVSGTPFEQARVVMCTSAGGETWTCALSEQSGAEIFLSPDGAAVIASSYTSTGVVRTATAMLDSHGTALHVFPLLMRHADIDPLSKRFVVADRDEVISGSLDTPAEMRRWILTREESCVTGVTSAGTSVGILAERIRAGSDGLLYVDPLLVILDASGRETYREVFTGTSTGPSHIQFRQGKIHVAGDNVRNSITVSPYE
jgi:hypothetical protein